MKMIEMHLIQSVPASNINRGEDGDPKTATFGGTLRHRVSSQCWKRAIRTNIQEHYKNNSENYGILSKEYSDYIKTLCPTVDPKLVESNLKTLEILPKNDKNCVLMYFSKNELQEIANYINGTSTSSKKDLVSIVKNAKNQIPFDIALFGRMFASHADLNVYGALQTTQALSTHSIEIEEDYFTAVDQLKSSQGSGHIGNNAFTSSTLYRYYNLDIEQLKRNLFETDIKSHVELLIKNVINSFPIGKENSMFGHSRPAYVNLIVKNGQPQQMMDAFETPIVSNNGYIKPSIEAYKNFKNEQISMWSDEILLDIEIPGTSLNEAISKISEYV